MLHFLLFFYLAPTVENAWFPRVKIRLYFARSKAAVFFFSLSLSLSLSLFFLEGWAENYR